MQPQRLSEPVSVSSDYYVAGRHLSRMASALWRCSQKRPCSRLCLPPADVGPYGVLGSSCFGVLATASRFSCLSSCGRCGVGPFALVSLGESGLSVPLFVFRYPGRAIFLSRISRRVVTPPLSHRAATFSCFKLGSLACHESASPMSQTC